MWNIGHARIRDQFKSPVYVQEKIDGSQFSFQKVDGVLKFKSKKVELFEGCDDTNFKAAVANLVEIKDKFVEGLIFRGEVMRSHKHNTMAYDRCPEKNIVIFDVQPCDGDWFLPDLAQEICEEIGLEYVRNFFDGKAIHIDSAEACKALLEEKSMLGGRIEGIVFKNYKEENGLGLGQPCFCKLVCTEFKERNDKDWKNRNPGRKDVLDNIVEIFRTQARWDKAIQHLEDEGKLTHEPKDIGLLMKEVPDDILEEDGDEIKEKLWKYFWPQIRRRVCGGLAEYYKEKLLQSQFEEKEDELLN